MFSQKTQMLGCLLNKKLDLNKYISFYLFLYSERMGKVAPSVFSGVRTGGETVLSKPADAKDPAASVFSK